MPPSQFGELMRAISEFRTSVDGRLEKIESRLDSLEQTRAHEAGRREAKQEVSRSVQAKIGLAISLLGFVSGWAGSHLRF